MLFDELKQQLKNIDPVILVIQSFWKNTNIDVRLAQLSQEADQHDFWKNPNQSQISKELQQLRQYHEQYSYIINTYTELQEMVDLFGQDVQELEKIALEVEQLKKAVAVLKINLLLNKPEDAQDCFININAGAGGTESQDWANMLLRMYIRFCEHQKLTVKIIDYQDGEEAGIKSATLFIKGKNPFGLLKSEHGIHRLVRISPFDANKRRHTSFASITAIPEAADLAVEIVPSDLRIDTFCASGAGGQHVNKTESAVRITHIPTGIVTQCQSERSQLQNKETALKMLRSKLAQKLKDEQSAKLGAIERKKIEWGSQIRSYVLHPYKMVKDHRTDYESSQPDLILDGELMHFIESFLIWDSTL